MTVGLCPGFIKHIPTLAACECDQLFRGYCIKQVTVRRACVHTPVVFTCLVAILTMIAALLVVAILDVTVLVVAGLVGTI